MTIDLVQGTAEWRAARLGKLTSSRISDAFAGVKTAGRANLIAALVAERLSGVAPESYTNDAMRWGTEKEPEARDTYEMWANVDVRQVGFIDHPSIAYAGCSPDGLVGDTGLIEIKCPNTATHIETLLGGGIDPKYLKQMHWQMACTGCAWCDYVSFDPRMPLDMQIHVQRVHRLDAEDLEAFESAARDVLAEVDKRIDALTARFRREAA